MTVICEFFDYEGGKAAADEFDFCFCDRTMTLDQGIEQVELLKGYTVTMTLRHCVVMSKGNQRCIVSKGDD